MNRAAPGRFERVAPIVVAALVALAWRAVYLHQLRDHPEFLQPVLDGAANLASAREWLAGAWPGNEPYFRAPGAIWGIGAGLVATGDDPVRLAALQILLGAVTPALTALLALSMFGVGAAWVAGLAAAFDPMLPFYDGQLLDSFLQMPLFLGAAAASWSAVRSPNAGRLAFAGALWGAAATVRPPLLLAAFVFPVAVAGGATGAAGRGRWARASWALAWILAIPAAVSWHNVRCGDPIFLASQGGLNLYLGNARTADGLSATFPDDPTALGYAMLASARRSAEAREGRDLRASEVSSHYVRRTFEEIRAEPGRWARLLARKFAVFWTSREIPNNHDPALFAESIPLLRWSPGWGFWAPWGIAAAWWLRRRPPTRFLAAVVAAVCLASVAFFVAGRFRVPAFPLLAVLAGAGVAETIRLARARAVRPLVGFIALGAGLLFVLQSNPARLPSGAWVGSYLLVAEAERERGETMRALAWVERALEREPGLYAARRAQLELLRRAGRLDEARAVAERLVLAAPDDPALRVERAALFDLAGDSRRAIEEIDAALAIDPDFDAARVHRGVALARRGDADEARRELEAFLRDRPRSPDAPRARAALEAIANGELGPR